MVNRTARYSTVYMGVPALYSTMQTVCTAGPISVYVRTVTTEATAGTALQPEPTSARCIVTVCRK